MSLPPGRFDPGVERWLAATGGVRDTVRQELVRRQLAAHLPTAGGRPLRVLDVGCGQATQAVWFARSGHHVVGVDISERMVEEARRAASQEDPAIRARLDFRLGDLVRLGEEHSAAYDVVCCHGVAMYLPALDEVAAALCRAAAPDGLISVLTRNRAAIAMRAGVTGDWKGAIDGFDARLYDNRVGIEGARADAPGEVGEALSATGADTEAWYGVRLFTDHWGAIEPGDDIDGTVAVEYEAGRREPYRSLCALTHTLARRRTTST